MTTDEIANETPANETPDPTLDRSATYSPEDNKLRFYPDPYEGKLPPEEYEQLKDLGFRWAPMQKLFVCPRWTPQAEDLLLDWCGEITPEGTTLADRAEAKAERLEALADKREADALGFANYSREIGQRFAGGQPILMGHHSQRKAERDRDKMQAAMEKARRATELAQYWTYKAAGVGRYANAKNSDRTRANRIKTLLADLRKFQRTENFKARGVALWDELIKDEPAPGSEKREKWESIVLRVMGAWTEEGRFAPANLSDILKEGAYFCQKERRRIEVEEVPTFAEACERARDFCANEANKIHRQRWIAHILGRLSFERFQLGEVARFEGEFTPAILQAFARTHGTDKPKAKKDAGQPSRPAWGPTWTITSNAPIPAHLVQGDAKNNTQDPNAITLSEHEWREIMHGMGYDVETKKGPPPILNFKIEADELLVIKSPYNRNGLATYRQVTITKEQKAKLCKASGVVRLALCGGFRFRVSTAHALAEVGALTPPENLDRLGRSNWGHERIAVFVEGSKKHPRPDSPTGIQKNPNTQEA